ncbi:WxL domain-containing protein [Enterococcus thailandicus]|uniref:WxL domain-containing protein n=2 Tax=Enterococcus thailandicus TaxID=417368 RepID=UPI0022EC0463|nr:WxL domain-containing protein [Enterococcus thailandicus]MDA3973160.1 WxL domain-containing protein [Enterococcus thailandicus]MDA3975406.1 WxL domain-containing protein [Enterococcus thailandicus]MDA3980620.1 WxL domain-containing protein [Enterococcus thailandicus]
MKTMRMYSAIFLLALSYLAANANVYAGETEANYESNGLVEFIPNTDPTDPVDPTDPTDPVVPVDPTDPTGPKPGTDGPLSIDYASSFDFGLNKITNKDETYYARAQQYKAGTAKGATANYVQVSDNRGNNAGWTLKVKQNGQLTATTETLNKILTGSAITLTAPLVNSNSTATVYPVANPTVSLNPDGSEVLVMSASVNTGGGTYTDSWGTVETVTEKDKDGNEVEAEVTKAVSLTVPGSTPKDAVKYSTTLTWNLTDVPGN